jgi:hypothetical protein
LVPDRLEVRAARHEGDVLSRPRELRPEESRRCLPIP